MPYYNNDEKSPWRIKELLIFVSFILIVYWALSQKPPRPILYRSAGMTDRCEDGRGHPADCGVVRVVPHEERERLPP